MVTIISCELKTLFTLFFAIALSISSMDLLQKYVVVIYGFIYKQKIIVHIIVLHLTTALYFLR